MELECGHNPSAVCHNNGHSQQRQTRFRTTTFAKYWTLHVEWRHEKHVTTGYERKYANRLLTGSRKFREHKGRGKTYGDEVAEVLKRVWREAGCPCLPYFKAEVVRWVEEYATQVDTFALGGGYPSDNFFWILDSTDRKTQWTVLCQTWNRCWTKTCSRRSGKPR